MVDWFQNGVMFFWPNLGASASLVWQILAIGLGLSMATFALKPKSAGVNTASPHANPALGDFLYIATVSLVVFCARVEPPLTFGPQLGRY